MRFGSLFAGIGGFDEALRRCGSLSAWAAENNPQCNAVRRRHFPDEQTIECVTAVSGRGFGCDIITAGWPCQGNSVAGRRAGMADERSGLWSEVKRVLAEQRPEWFFGENVPGILSVNGGWDWLAVLRDLAKLGYGFAYRILDAQWFGVAQRRRRVFIVGHLGDWRRAAKVLFEPEGLPWDPPPSRESGKGVARGVAACLNSGGNSGGFRTEPGEHLVAHTLRAEGFDASEDGTGRGTPLVPIAFDCKQSGEGGEVSPPLRAMSHDKSHANAGGQVAVAYQCHGTNVGPMGHLRAGNGNETGGVPFVLSGRERGDDGRGYGREPHISDLPQLDATKPGRVVVNMAVRRLTPLECERLQGFPDDWTRYGEHGEEIADGLRYRMLGNAVAVPVVEWIGRRIVAATKTPP